MLYAINDHGEKILAQPKKMAICPFCQSAVIAKCGVIKKWHWAHESKEECDDWWEPETAWHLAWKSLFPADCVEVNLGSHRADIVNKNGVVIELQHSPISPEAIEQREKFYGERMIWIVDGMPFAEKFWIGDLIEEDDVLNKLYETVHLANITSAPGIVSKYRWKYRRKVWEYCNNPIFIDFGEQGTPMQEGFNHILDKKTIIDWTDNDDLFWIKKFYDKPEQITESISTYNDDYSFWRMVWEFHGVGQFVKRDRFIEKYAIHSQGKT